MSVPSIFKECHRLRRHLRELKDEIDRGPRMLKAQQQRLTDAEKAHKDAYDKIKQLKLKQKEEEGLLKSLEANLAKLADRAMTVTTMKEMEATKHEIENAAGKKSICEDAILGAMTEIEERTADIPNVEKRWARGPGRVQAVSDRREGTHGADDSRSGRLHREARRMGGSVAGGREGHL